MTAEPQPIVVVRGVAVDLPWPPKLLSPNARPHHHQLARAKARYREDCRLLTRHVLAGLYGRWERLELGDGEIRVHLDFHPATNAPRDDDNLEAAFKAGRDGVADALGVDDRRFRTTKTLHAADRRVPNPLAHNPFEPKPRGWVRVTVGEPAQGRD